VIPTAGIALQGRKNANRNERETLIGWDFFAPAMPGQSGTAWRPRTLGDRKKTAEGVVEAGCLMEQPWAGLRWE